MSRIPDHHNPALLIVDVQTGVMQGAWDAERIIANIARSVATARHEGVPVIWVQHTSPNLVHGSPAWQWVPELQPAEGEARIDKQFNSAFEQTGLEALLQEAAVGHIVLAGAATNWCIRATAYGALERGYDLTLIEDGHTTDPLEAENGEQVAAAALILDLNTVMSWISYPGRTVRVLPAETAALTRLEVGG
jgi:nicotinamidase-related amidase